MHNTSIRLWIVAALALLMPWAAHAAGLGKLTVTSALGQPLAAQIELVSVQRDEAGSLAARLASVEAYRQANLQYHPALASLRFSIEQRPGAQPYIRITSTRPINEPVVDLLIELAWASGRISRAYTALIDPPGYTPGSSPAEAVAVPEVAPGAPPAAPVEARPITPPRAAAAAPQPPAPGEYGPVKRGDTLTGVARSVMPEGVTLEQMLVGLYRSNPDAFVNNMNRLKTGRILRVPDKAEIAAIAPAEATSEVRVQAADWQAYRRRLADAAAQAQEGSAASGRITARVEDPAAAEGSRDVVRLSKGEALGAPGGTGKGAAAAAGERLRALEEEAVAREKALNEANERIAQLEKTIREQQRLIELKGAPLGTQPPAQPPSPAAPGSDAAAPAPAPSADKPQAPAPAPAQEKPAPAPQPAPDAKPKPKAAPPQAQPEPSFMDTLLDEPLYLAAAGGLLVLFGLMYVLGRRRRGSAQDAGFMAPAAPTFVAPAATEPVAAPAPQPVEPAMVMPMIEPSSAPEEVDALAEAEVYIAYGRDAQAEEILKEALAKTPARQDVELKLLEIYAARKDHAAFRELAGKLRQQTGGEGENWTKVSAMGRALDPADDFYAVGGAAIAAAAAAAVAAPAEPLDLELGTRPAAPDLPLDATTTPAAAVETPPAPESAVAENVETPPEAAPDFTLDLPSAASDATPVAATTDSNVIDFSLELPPTETPAATATPAAGSEPAADPGLDFKLDFGDIDLNLDGEAPAAAVVAADKDPHWHDVQQKFDLAKAYEEMGDKEGAREVLQEVIGEGDDEQQAQAKRLLEALA